MKGVVFNVVEEVSRYTTDIGGRGVGNLDDTYFTLKLTGAVELIRMLRTSGL